MIEDRFWAKVDKTETCWLWTGSLNQQGYGQVAVRVAGRQTSARAHRFAHELLVGPIPDGLELDHLCRVRNCVNPAHLEPVTHAENLRRSPTAFRRLGDRQRAKTHCPQGHPYDEANTARYGCRRYCIACRNKRNRARRAA